MNRRRTVALAPCSRAGLALAVFAFVAPRKPSIRKRQTRGPRSTSGSSRSGSPASTAISVPLGPATASRPGHWGVAGPGISAEWTQGGESEWNSMGAPADETKAVCGARPRRAARGQVPRLGAVRRSPQEDRAVHGRRRAGRQAGCRRASSASSRSCRRTTSTSSTGASRSAGASFDGDLAEGPATRRARRSTRPARRGGRSTRSCITDDLNYAPVGREKPPFAYLGAFDLQPKDGAAWRGAAKDAVDAGSVARPCARRPRLHHVDRIDADAEVVGEAEPDVASHATTCSSSSARRGHPRRSSTSSSPAGRTCRHVVAGPGAGLLPRHTPGPVARHAAAARGWSRRRRRSTS